MNEPKAQQDPSMEEILASIRRIIAEGEEADQQAEESSSEEAEDDNVLELTEVVDESEPEDIEIDLVEDDSAPEEPVAEPEPEPEPEPEATAEPDLGAEPVALEAGIVSEETAIESGGAFAELARSIAAADSPAPDASPRLSQGYDRTLEEIVQVVLRPLLKDWLDKNLPSLVHHLVKKEVERLSRR